MTNLLPCRIRCPLFLQVPKPCDDKLGQDFIDASGIFITSFVLPSLVTIMLYSTDEPE